MYRLNSLFQKQNLIREFEIDRVTEKGKRGGGREERGKKQRMGRKEERERQKDREINVNLFL